MSLVRFTSEELRLIREYVQIRRRADAVEPTIPDGNVDIGLDPDERPVFNRIPSGQDCLAAWKARYSSTEAFIARVHVLRDQLLGLLAEIPEPPRNRKGTREELENVREQVETARRAVSLWARYLLALEALTSIVAARSQHARVVSFNRLSVGRTVMYDPRYRNYDRWRLRLARTKSKVRRANASYEAARRTQPERKEYQRTYHQEYRRRP